LLHPRGARPKKKKKFSKLSGGISNIILKVALRPDAAARAASAASAASASASPSCRCRPTPQGEYQPLSGPFTEAAAVKVFGDKTDLVVDRAAEAAAVAALAGAGFGPQVLATFANGRAERFLHCHTLLPAQMARPPCRGRIAAALARFHAVRPGPPHDPSRPSLWPSVRRWLDQARSLDWAPEAVPDSAKREGAAQLDFDTLEADVARVRRACGLTRSPVVFAHNDLLSGNILVLRRAGRGDGEPAPRQQGEEDQERAADAAAPLPAASAAPPPTDDGDDDEAEGPLTFIDFEYGAYNPRGFDLANHFNEYAGFECDYGRYPHGDAAKAEFLAAYLAAAAEAGLPVAAAAAPSDRAAGEEPEEEGGRARLMSRLCAEVDVFSLASHAYWGVWSIIQARHSPIDFDYMSYHFLRWAELRKRLDAFCERAEREFGPSSLGAGGGGGGGGAEGGGGGAPAPPPLA